MQRGRLSRPAAASTRPSLFLLWVLLLLLLFLLRPAAAAAAAAASDSARGAGQPNQVTGDETFLLPVLRRPRAAAATLSTTSTRFELLSESSSPACSARFVELRARAAPSSSSSSARPGTDLSAAEAEAAHVLHIDGLACRVSANPGGGARTAVRVDGRRDGDNGLVAGDDSGDDDGALVLRPGDWWLRTRAAALRSQQHQTLTSAATTRQQADAIAAIASQMRSTGAVTRHNQWAAAALRSTTLHCGRVAHRIYQTRENAVVFVVRTSAPVAMPSTSVDMDLAQGTWLLFAHTPPLRPRGEELSQHSLPMVSCVYRAVASSSDGQENVQPQGLDGIALPPARQTSGGEPTSTTPQSTSTKSQSKHGTSVWAWLGIIPAAIALLIIIAAIVSMYLKSRKPMEEPKAWPTSPVSSRRSNFLGETQGTSVHRLEATV